MTIDIPSDPGTLIWLLLWVASELIGKSDRIQANGIFQLISSAINRALVKGEKNNG